MTETQAKGTALLVENGIVVNRIVVPVDENGDTTFQMPNPPEGPVYHVVQAPEELGVERGWTYDPEAETFTGPDVFPEPFVPTEETPTVETPDLESEPDADDEYSHLYA